MGDRRSSREEWNRVRHPEEVPEEVDALSAPGWDRGDVILGTWQEAAEYARNVRRLEERGMVPRHDKDQAFLERLYGDIVR